MKKTSRPRPLNLKSPFGQKVVEPEQKVLESDPDRHTLPPVWPDELPWVSKFSDAPELRFFPEPHVRFFPHPRGLKREVKIKVSTWKGVSVGAIHYYVKFDEDANPLWNPYEGKWDCPHDDHEYLKGGELFDRELHCLSLDEAKSRAERIVIECYKDWTVTWDEQWAEIKKWTYGEGA